MRLIIMFALLGTILFSTSACQNDESKETETPTEKQVKKEEKKLYKQNEEAFITDENGENIYSLTIDSAEAIAIPEDYVDNMPEGTQKILVLTYTYKYIKENADIASFNLEEGLAINPWDLQVYDEDGLSISHIDLAASDYPFDADIYFTEGLNVGRSKQIYAGYSLPNETTTIQIDFNSVATEQILTFDIPVEQK